MNSHTRRADLGGPGGNDFILYKPDRDWEEQSREPGPPPPTGLRAPGQRLTAPPPFPLREQAENGGGIRGRDLREEEILVSVCGGRNTDQTDGHSRRRPGELQGLSRTRRHVRKRLF